MVKRTHVVLEDDLDHSEAAETLSFALEGVTYEIDLSASNAQKLRDDLAAWVGHARRTGGRRSSGRKAASPAGGANEIRAWAQANGYEVNARGRVPHQIREAFEKATNK